MEAVLATCRLSALAQEGRLRVYRIVVQAGPEGMSAGDIARSMGIPANTLSAQLNVLANAGMVDSRRAGRSIIYTADLSAMASLLAFLTLECCEGRPEVMWPDAPHDCRGNATAREGR